MFSKRKSNSVPQARRRPQPRQPIRDISQTTRQNQVFSYYNTARSQNDLNVGRENVQQKSIKRRLPTRITKLREHASLLFLVVLALIFIVFELQLSPVPKVVSLATSSDAPFLRSTNTYQAAATKLFESSAANRNKLTINASAITDKFRAEFPELADASITLPFLGNRPILYIQPADPALILTTQSSGTFVIDDNGRALISADSTTNLTQFHVATVTDQSGLQLKAGQQALASTSATFIRTVVSQLEAQGISIKAAVLPPAASELDVYISGKPYFVKFNLNDTQPNAAEEQAGAYTAVSKHLTAQGITPSQYIDVRLEGRAYYQ